MMEEGNMNSAKTTSNEKLQANIVVIGGGGSGLAAAVAAAEAGVKSIIVLEARQEIGGNAVFPEGIFAAESRAQKRLAIDARKDEMFKLAMSFAHWKTNPRLVRALVNKSGDTIRWLESKGVEFAGIIHHYPNQVPLVYHIIKPPGRTGSAVVEALSKNCKDLGVQVLCGAEAKKLITDKKGNVIGVSARRGNKEVNISTKSVILATGGFAGNPELLKKYIPSYNEEEIRNIGLPHKGDGLRMATEIGAATEGMVTLEMFGPAPAGPLWPLSIYPIISRPNTIWVNKNGERFADETVTFVFSEAANAIFRQPHKTSYTVFDEKIKQSIIEEGLTPHDEISLGDAAKSWPAGLDDDLQSQADKGLVKISHSWSDIAQFIGATRDVLQHTIDEYNYFCDHGHDEIFAKDREYLMPLRTPPYYAIKCGLGVVTTHGGIKINHRMEVLNPQDVPIRGLYAAGVETGGTDADTYNVLLSGHSFGFTINSGRIAGENAARYVLDVKK
jgi:fumarate reductase flavoprotein subunit